ncbi:MULTISPECIES: cupin domain-containing protein [unclassified Streptomyces]|uniref:cupin domain-containing protein n=1 Tax=unclassified Streptomyces TaxID=2593676 RepID=UPI000364764A|nr:MULTISPECIES: cupin domain-containing protein [unclassified Streptomyces]MYT33203.1 cupin domain-containing protein [Streptomyces sp. SID8354]
MSLVALRKTAANLPDAWSSRLLGRIGGAGVKVLRMDGSPLARESHGAAEALLVLEGTLCLTVGDADVEVGAGEMYIVGPGVEHAVRPGSNGTLVIVEHLADVPCAGGTA